LSLWHLSITLPHGMGKEWEEKKNVPYISLWRELKFLFFNFIKETEKGRQKRTKKLHFNGQGWGGRHCGNATSLA
jgi:hypothetical protein